MIERLTAPLRWLCLSLLLFLLAACGGPEEPERGPTVLAASSLQEALEEVGDAWTAQGRPAPVLSFAATSALARQAEQGAPADLFVSADEEWMDTLADENLLRAGTRRDLLTNRLVLISSTIPQMPAAAMEDGEGFRRALAEGRLALADPDAVPAGKYARASLEEMGLWDEVSDRVVPTENVRAALALVSRGEAELGIVYATDATAGGATVVGLLPEASHPPIRYPVAILEGSQHPDAAAFLAFLSSAEAKRIFERHGFGTIR